jgi:hypothetical protein
MADWNCQLVPMMRRDANGGSATNQGRNLQHTKPQMTPPAGAVTMLSGQRGSFKGWSKGRVHSGPAAGDNRHGRWLRGLRFLSLKRFSDLPLALKQGLNDSWTGFHSQDPFTFAVCLLMGDNGEGDGMSASGLQGL